MDGSALNDYTGRRERHVEGYGLGVFHGIFIGMLLLIFAMEFLY